ncbi:MAG: tungstate ABC transporter substrate-binding protein WtpA [Bacillota bacterium]|nr:tungstate ABC transporter substrate-binding protein WtpA [Bacillota bacterium]
MKKIVLPVVILSLAISLFGCANNDEDVSKTELEGEVIVYHAGSLTIPFENVEKAFEEKYPNIDVIRTPGGSRAVTRKIVEFEDKVDVLASADYAVIDTLMIPDYADWNALFAQNSMVIMYSEDSRYSNDITSENWHEILLKEDVNYGHSEPNADPCGYRSLLTMQLAEKHYKMEGLYDGLIEVRKDKNIRPKSVELIAMLETGALDYAFEYESVAMQHQLLNPELKYIKLPNEINLSSIEFKDFYSQASVELSGSEPGSTITRTAAPIVYSLTMPTTGENEELALLFLEFLFDRNQGMKILNESGQPVLDEITVFGEENFPESLKNVVK